MKTSRNVRICERRKILRNRRNMRRTRQNAARKKSGLKLFDEAMSRFGYAPKIILAPEYNATAAVLKNVSFERKTINDKDAITGNAVIEVVDGEKVNNIRVGVFSYKFTNAGPWKQLLQ